MRPLRRSSVAAMCFAIASRARPGSRSAIASTMVPCWRDSCRAAAFGVGRRRGRRADRAVDSGPARRHPSGGRRRRSSAIVMWTRESPLRAPSTETPRNCSSNRRRRSTPAGVTRFAALGRSGLDRRPDVDQMVQSFSHVIDDPLRFWTREDPSAVGGNERATRAAALRPQDPFLLERRLIASRRVVLLTSSFGTLPFRGELFPDDDGAELDRLAQALDGLLERALPVHRTEEHPAEIAHGIRAKSLGLPLHISVPPDRGSGSPSLVSERYKIVPLASTRLHRSRGTDPRNRSGAESCGRD